MPRWAANLKALAVVLITAAAMIAIDLGRFRTSRNPSSGLDPLAVNAWSTSCILRKLIGFAATLGLLAGLYSILPEYAGSFYDPARQAALASLPFLLVCAPFYIIYIDRRQRDPEDAYAQLGRLIAGQGFPDDWTALAQHARGWLVKGFFFPLMFVYLSAISPPSGGRIFPRLRASASSMTSRTTRSSSSTCCSPASDISSRFGCLIPTSARPSRP